MMDSMDLTVAILVGCFMLLLAFLVALPQENWEKDCNTIGMHRHGDQVYICSKKVEK